MTVYLHHAALHGQTTCGLDRTRARTPITDGWRWVDCPECLATRIRGDVALFTGDSGHVRLTREQLVTYPSNLDHAFAVIRMEAALRGLELTVEREAESGDTLITWRTP